MFNLLRRRKNQAIITLEDVTDKELAVTELAPEPLEPQGLVEQPIPIFKWKPVEGADSYKLALVNQQENTTLVVSGLVQPNWAPKGMLLPGVSYHWMVAAIRGTKAAFGPPVPFQIDLALGVVKNVRIPAPNGAFVLWNQAVNAGVNADIFLGSFADAHSDGPWNIAVKWADNTPNGNLNLNMLGPVHAAHNFANAGEYQVMVTVTNSLKWQFTTAVLVTAVEALTAVRGNNAQVTPGVPGTIALGSFADPALDAGPWSISIDWGDGMSPDSFELVTQGRIAATHQYSVVGTYLAHVTVKNTAGAEANCTTTIVVAGPSNSFTVAGPQRIRQG